MNRKAKHELAQALTEAAGHVIDTWGEVTEVHSELKSIEDLNEVRETLTKWLQYLPGETFDARLKLVEGGDPILWVESEGETLCDTHNLSAPREVLPGVNVSTCLNEGCTYELVEDENDIPSIASPGDDDDEEDEESDGGEWGEDVDERTGEISTLNTPTILADGSLYSHLMKIQENS